MTIPLPNWIACYRDRFPGPLPGTYRARYSLSYLAERGALDRGAVNRLLDDSGLRDFTWHAIWADDHATSDDELTTQLTAVDGYVVFIHGVTASWQIWEELPALTVQENPQLVALSIDHNGFGETPFVSSLPALEHVSPKATMGVIEAWFNLLGLRRPDGVRAPRVVNFVGHSMGGAALFYLNEGGWRYGEQTRLAIAPALLIDDQAHKVFFNVVGFGAGIVERVHFLEDIENIISHPTLRTLTDGATQAVMDEHVRIYELAAKGVTANAMAAMGLNRDRPPAHYRDLMRVVLGHRDLLVGLVPMLDLLQELQFTVDQVQVVLGTHYLFSLGEAWKTWHVQNRAIVVRDILDLHNAALLRQR